MKTLTKGQIQAVLTACLYFRDRWPNEEYIQTLEEGIEKLQSNLRGRTAQDTMNKHRKAVVSRRVAERGSM